MISGELKVYSDVIVKFIKLEHENQSDIINFHICVSNKYKKRSWFNFPFQVLWGVFWFDAVPVEQWMDPTSQQRSSPVEVPVCAFLCMLALRHSAFLAALEQAGFKTDLRTIWGQKQSFMNISVSWTCSGDNVFFFITCYTESNTKHSPICLW